MTIDLDTIEFRAVVATSGPWKAVDTPAMTVRNEIHDENGARIAMALTTRHPRDGEQFIDFDQAEANAAFIASANPQTVLELIAEVRKARADTKTNGGQVMEWTKNKPTVEGMYWCRCIDQCGKIVGQADIMYFTPEGNTLGCTWIETYDEFAGPIPEPKDRSQCHDDRQRTD